MVLMWTNFSSADKTKTKNAVKLLASSSSKTYFDPKQRRNPTGFRRVGCLMELEGLAHTDNTGGVYGVLL